jgi:hypothetical protein
VRMSLRETRRDRVSRMVGGARDPSGYNRSGAFGTARHWSLTTEQSPDFPVERTRQVTVTEQPYPIVEPSR